MGDPEYPLFPLLMKEFSGVGENKREKIFFYKFSSVRIPIENLFGRLKGHFRCLQRVRDVKLHTLPQVIYSCFVLHKYCEDKKEDFPDQNLMSVLSFEKKAQTSTSFLSYGERVNENLPCGIHLQKIKM